MDLIEDEPRQHPKPVPFCQNSLLQPVVPEVSLVLQDNFHPQIEKKSDSFSGTEFQTYNSWRWKHMNQNNDKLSNIDALKKNKNSTVQDCYLIKDKYFISDLEKRKNEILYGDKDEPRRPLPPRTNTGFPNSVESFLSEMSFDVSKPVFTSQEKSPRALKHEGIQEKKIASRYIAKNFNEKPDNSEKLYSIISEQNKQVQGLQKQIDQLLKLQEVKDKQIEQLLNSQESKERKIEQLMHSLEAKNTEIKHFFSINEKQEQHLQDLLKSNESKQNENLSLIKKLSELKQKEMCSVGVMTSSIQMTDASTSTILDDIIAERESKKAENSIGEISFIRGSSKIDEKEKSLSLHSSDLPVIQENVPTPQSSIHLDIQDFPDSSDDSETEAGIPSNSFSTAKENHSNPLGYTFYNNVLMQLNEIIQNSAEKANNNNAENNNAESKGHFIRKPDIDYNFIVENKGAMQSFHSWNVFEKENVPPDARAQEKNDKILEKSPNICLKDTYSPSDISLKINALALKYLKEEQISQCALQQSQIPTCQHDVTIYNVTNLSFGSMRYLDRYQMLPKVMDNQKQVIDYKKNESSPTELLRRRNRTSVQQNVMSSVGNVLDISTLNQQPKLL